VLGLARRADVVVENFRPGVMDKLGLGYERLSQEKPALVFCSITALLRPRAELPGYDCSCRRSGG